MFATIKWGSPDTAMVRRRNYAMWTKSAGGTGALSSRRPSSGARRSIRTGVGVRLRPDRGGLLRNWSKGRHRRLDLRAAARMSTHLFRSWIRISHVGGSFLQRERLTVPCDGERRHFPPGWTHDERRYVNDGGSSAL